MPNVAEEIELIAQSPSRRRRSSPVSLASSATSDASTRPSDSSTRLGLSCHPVPAFGSWPLPPRRSCLPTPASSTGGDAGAHGRRYRGDQDGHVWWQAFTHEDLATVLERAGRIDEAREALERSLAIWERKRCLPYAQRVREQIESLGRAQV